MILRELILHAYYRFIWSWFSGERMFSDASLYVSWIDILQTFYTTIGFWIQTDYKTFINQV